MLPADRYTQQTHQSRRKKGRAAETRNLYACVSEERGRGLCLCSCYLLTDTEARLLQFTKKKIPRHSCTVSVFFMYSQQ